MSEFFSMALGIIQTLAVSIALLFFEQRLKRSDGARKSVAAARKEEALLLIDMQLANLAYTEAVAVAVQEKRFNGELKNAKALCDRARSNYRQFTQKQTREYLEGE